MIKVHHLDNSRSQRILWCLEEIGTPYEIVSYKRDPKTLRAPGGLRRIHPLGKAPILEEDGKVFAESGVIIEYLVARHGPQFAPTAGNDGYCRYRYWMHYAEGSLMPQLLLKLVADKLGLLAFPIRKMVGREVALHLDHLEAEAGKYRWIAGDDLTAADFMMSYPLEAATHRAGLGPSRPNLWRLLTQIHERPAYRRALERGRLYTGF